MLTEEGCELGHAWIGYHDVLLRFIYGSCSQRTNLSLRVPFKPVKPALRHSSLEPTHRLALQVTVIVDAQVYTKVPFADKVAGASLRTNYDPTGESLHSWATALHELDDDY